jgi:YegS C-terminal NAD kinase beta sandwich-like domain
VTVRRGEDWGRRAPRPADLVEVADDATGAALVDAARRGGRPLPVLGLRGGDLRRTLGGGPPVDHLPDEVGEYPVDVGLVVLDGVERAFLAHLVARRGWWRGEVVAAMNAEQIGGWDVAPRGHPNDGRLDVLHVVDLGLGDRYKAWRRLPTGTHVPHPGIDLRSRTTVDLALRRPLTVWLDGHRAGTTDHLAVRVEPDALTVCI